MPPTAELQGVKTGSKWPAPVRTGLLPKPILEAPVTQIALSTGINFCRLTNRPVDGNWYAVFSDYAQASRKLACKRNDKATEGLLIASAVSSSTYLLYSNNSRGHTSTQQRHGIFELTDGPKAQSCRQQSSGVQEVQERITGRDQARSGSRDMVQCGTLVSVVQFVVAESALRPKRGT